MAVVGYLFGAGASAQCIPVVNGMKEDLDKIIGEVGDYFAETDSAGGYYIPTTETRFQTIKQTFQFLSEVCDSHYSIDTYAKKLYLTDAEKFLRLKLDLSLYFTIRQILTKPDKRYDNFFSSIITSESKLPASIKIISWNYDFQLEKSYCEFNPGLNINMARVSLGINSPKRWAELKSKEKKFKTVKLNGSARLTTDGHDGFMFSALVDSKEQLVLEVVDRYISIIDNRKTLECELKFAWENEHYNKLFESAKEDLEMIEVLVIIGYSFPFFNREVDDRLFKSMRNLETIYIQDLNPELIKETMEEFVKLKIGRDEVIEVIYKRNKDQFVFPKELNVLS
jgi:hypothetical protein